MLLPGNHLRYTNNMHKESDLPNPGVPKHLIDDINSIGSEVYKEIGVSEEDQYDTEAIKSQLIKNLVVDLLNRIVAPACADAHQDRIRLELAASATSILRKMSFPIDDYDSLLGTHDVALVADKLIEAKRCG